MPKIGKSQINRTLRRKINYQIRRINLINHKPSILAFTSDQPINNVESTEYTATSTPEELNCHQVLPDHNIITSKVTATPLSPKYDSNKETIEKLINWSVKYNIKRSAVSSILSILKVHQCFQELPKDSRTLLKTPRTICLREISPGKYCHFSLVNSLQNILQKSDRLIDSVSLQFNVDGLPISRSSSQQFWPILAHVTELPNTYPFPVGIYFGEDKPKSSNEFLKQFVDELLEVNEVRLNDQKIVKVKIHSIVCDAPARAFILNVKGHTGYFGCQKCCIEGDYISHRITYQELSCDLRTNTSFRLQANEEHHLEHKSELLRLPIDIVKQIPLDYQHLVCLGVVRKLIYLWLKGKVKRYKLSANTTHLLSKRLIALKPFVSCEFVRKPRSLLHVNNWKATEYRTFLLYTGPVVLKGILPDLYYNHFLVLHVAITILCSKSLHQKLIEYASNLLKYFVEIFANLYGVENVSYNVHNLLHLAADSSKFGVLDDFSTFKFENYLGKIKLLLKSGNRPLEQVYNRLKEAELVISDNRAKQKGNPPFKDFSLHTRTGDNSFLLNDNSIFMVQSITNDKKQLQLKGNLLTEKTSFYNTPCNSEILGISIFSTKSDTIVISASSVKAKVLVFEVDSDFVVFPLLHTQ